MKRLTLVVTIIFAAMTLLSAPAVLANNGNGTPNGPHFTLNIHGVAKGQGFSGNNQNEIFVPLYGNCKIDLLQAPQGTYGVLNPDCVNNPPAEFELPAPCAISPTTGLCTGTTTYYSVWARALGTPGGSSSTQTCAYDSTGTLYCSINAFVAVETRSNGKPYFDNVSKDLLFLTTCNTTTGKTTSTPLFSQNYENYFWQYDNQGLRLLQLRFYQVSSPVPTSVSC